MHPLHAGPHQAQRQVDASDAYTELALAKEHQDRTGFVCQFGHFKLRRLGFGLCTAASIFQQAFMDRVLEPMQDICEAYQDDVAVWGRPH